MSNMAPWFPFYVDDWLDSESVFEMSLEEEGAYIRLLALMWRKGGHVPDNAQWICNGLRCKPAKWQKIRASFLQKDVIFCSDGKLFNTKLNENLRVFNEKSKKASQSANKRWENEPKKTNKNNDSANANALQAQCYRETETETETEEKKKDKEKKDKLAHLQWRVKQAQDELEKQLGQPAEFIIRRALNVRIAELQDYQNAAT